VTYSRTALRDLERIAEFFGPEATEAAAAATARVLEAVEMLARHPLVGRPVERGFRELVISRGKTGYVALYDFVEEEDAVLVLAIWHQRELQ